MSPLNQSATDITHTHTQCLSLKFLECTFWYCNELTQWSLFYVANTQEMSFIIFFIVGKIISQMWPISATYSGCGTITVSFIHCFLNKQWYMRHNLHKLLFFCHFTGSSHILVTKTILQHFHYDRARYVIFSTKLNASSYFLHYRMLKIA